MIQNAGDLKRICDISSGFFFFLVLHAEFQICLRRALEMANFCTDIKESYRICFENRGYID